MGCRYKSNLQLQARIARRREKEMRYEIEDILQHRVQEFGIYYLVKWRGYGEAENTWEPETEFRHAQDALHQYWAQWKLANSPSVRPRASRFRVKC